MPVMLPPGRLAGDETKLDRVPAGAENNRNCLGCGLGGKHRGRGARGNNDRDAAADQIDRQSWQLFGFIICPAVFDRDVVAFGEALLA